MAGLNGNLSCPLKSTWQPPSLMLGFCRGSWYVFERKRGIHSRNQEGWRDLLVGGFSRKKSTKLHYIESRQKIEKSKGATLNLPKDFCSKSSSFHNQVVMTVVTAGLVERAGRCLLLMVSAGVCAINVIFVALMVPETCDRTLGQIEASFK